MASSTDQDRRRRRKLHVSTVISRVLLAIILVLQVYPFVWLLQTSVKTPDDFASNSPFALPTSFTLDNFSRAISQGNLGTNILNSFIVTAASCLLIVICGMTGAYAIQVLDFRGSRFVRGLFLGVGTALEDRTTPLSDLVGAHETPAGLNEQVRRTWFDPQSAGLEAALDGVLRRVTGDAP